MGCTCNGGPPCAGPASQSCPCGTSPMCEARCNTSCSIFCQPQHFAVTSFDRLGALSTCDLNGLYDQLILLCGDPCYNVGLISVNVDCNLETVYYYLVPNCKLAGIKMNWHECYDDKLLSWMVLNVTT